MKRSKAASPQATLEAHVVEAILSTPALDIHTHLYDPAFKELLLWGIDELLVYHYLVAETVRMADLPEETFWSLSKEQQAERVWEELFLRHSPVSEACRGVVTTLNRLGLDPRKKDLPPIRRWFASQKASVHVTRCLELANLRGVCMTNSPFDDLERPVWEGGFERDERFHAALRIDPLLVSWPDASRRLQGWGYKVSPSLTTRTTDEVRRFLGDWSRRIGARYLMVSLGPEFAYPGTDSCARLLERAVLPFCQEAGLPFALMLGVRRATNPRLRLAGDGVGRSDLGSLRNLCEGHPENRFAVTVLSRENQHELCVLARKFRNLHPFGCWWFTNIPHQIEEMTRMRLELLGLSFTPQHSDARVLDQVIYKWDHTREVLGRVLMEKYEDLAHAGWIATREEVQRDVRDLLGGAFERFCRG
jgi:hypothetical protein